MPNKLEESVQEQYQTEKVLILGFGREGQSTYRLLRSVFPEKEIGVMDQKAIGAPFLQDAHLLVTPSYLTGMESFNVIFKTPGIPLTEPALQNFLQKGGRITSQLNDFLNVYAKQTIGVTGTKGKSTTSSLIFHLLKTAGHDTVLGGNIGVPVFDLAPQINPETEVVLEVSSYQLETVQHSPNVAVFLNLFPEHLNYHQGLENYIAAKERITKFQDENDTFIYNDQFPELQKIAQNSVAQKVAFSDQKYQEQLQNFQTQLAHLPKIVREENVIPTLVVARKFDVPSEMVGVALDTFKTLPHRLENLGQFKNITFYDDTLATIPEATVAAIQSIGHVDVIILGGYDRGIDYQLIADAVLTAQIPHLIFFPPSGEKMAELVQQKIKVAAPTQMPTQLPTLDRVTTMEEAVKLSYHYLAQGGVVLLSPASPSFSNFTDYEDKSRQYLEWIKKLSS